MKFKKLFKVSLFALITILAVACGKKDASVPAPIADFEFNPKTDIYRGSTVTFTNKSVNGKTYSWDFGDSTAIKNASLAVIPAKKTVFAPAVDVPVIAVPVYETVVPSGATSTLENPTKRFLYTGTYTVTLTVTGDGGTATKTASIVILGKGVKN